MRQIVIATILLTSIIACGKRDGKETVSEKENCDFSFEITVESPNSYKYNSETGHLQKLINPFNDKEIYADTTFFISDTAACKLLKLYQLYNLSEYPTDFDPESSIVMTPEPTYHIKFKVNHQETEINWDRNTETYESEEAHRLRKVLNEIDWIILTSPEFRQLPEQEYNWL